MAAESLQGGENLEVMAEAVNYTAYLIGLIERHAGDAKRIADFGAGIGTFAEAMRKRGHTPVCIEPDHDRFAALVAAGFETVAGIDALAAGTLDYVYTLNVLEHIEDDLAALRAIHSRLRPGGRLLVYVPAFQCLYSAMDHIVGHQRRYRRSALVVLLRQAGFTVEQARYADCLGFPAALAYRFAGDSSGRLNPGAVKLYDRLIFPVSRLLDAVFAPVAGKNLLAVAQRPE